MDRKEILTRNFIAIPLKTEIKEKINSFVLKQKSNLKNVRWEKKTNYHVTLMFVGNSTENQLKIIDEILAYYTNETENSEIIIKGIGVFPNVNRARVIWAGIEMDESLISFRNRIVSEIDERLKLKIDNKPFRPHLTIGRVKRGDLPNFFKREIQTGGKYEFGSQYADKIVHFRSELTPKGAIHTVINSYSLK